MEDSTRCWVYMVATLIAADTPSCLHERMLAYFLANNTVYAIGIEPLYQPP